MSVKSRAMAGGLMLVGLAGTTCVDAQTTQRFELAWRIVPQAPADEAIWVKPGEVVTTARLVPLSLLLSNEAYLSESGDTILPADAEMTLGASASIVACTIGLAPVSQVRKIWTGGAYLCLVDDNKDEKFDRYFYRNARDTSLRGGLMTIASDAKPLSGGGYRQGDPLATKTKVLIQLRYAYFASISGWLLFQPAIETADRSKASYLADTVGVKRADIPGDFDALGASFTVLAKEGNRVQVKMNRPFAPQTMTFDR